MGDAPKAAMGRQPGEDPYDTLTRLTEQEEALRQRLLGKGTPEADIEKALRLGRAWDRTHKMNWDTGEWA